MGAIGRGLSLAEKIVGFAGASNAPKASAFRAGAGAVREHVSFFRSPQAWADKHAWGLNAALDMATRLSAKADELTPSFVHTVSVTAQGGPTTDMRRLWYLVLAAAFGRLRNRVRGIQQTDMDATWDITGKACSVTVGYYNTGLIGAATRTASKDGGLSSPLALIHRGPDQVTVGGSWPSWLQATTTQSNGATAAFGLIGGVISDLRQKLGVAGPGIRQLIGVTSTNNPDAPGLILPPQWTPVFEIEGPGPPDILIKFVQNFNSNRGVFVETPVGLSTDSQFLPWSRMVPIGGSAVGRFGSRTNTATQLPTLPDDGRVITTGQKLDPRVQNARPPLDGKSRASLVQLVAAALGNPGLLPSSPPGGFVPLGSPGLYVYTPGQGLENDRSNFGRFTQAVNDVDVDSGVDVNPGPAVAPITPDGFTIDGYKITVSVPNVRQP